MTYDALLERADRSLRSAALLLADRDFSGACSRAYYAMFDAARAALIFVGQGERANAKTHRGLVSAFSEHLVLAGVVERPLGSMFSREMDRRHVADYEMSDLQKPDAEDAIDNARAFVGAIRALDKA